MKKKMRWKIFFIVVDFSRHISSVSFSHDCAKSLCTMDTHRFVCANFSHLFRREKREMKFAEKSKKNVAAQVEHWFDSGGRSTELSLLRNFNKLFSGEDQDQMWDIDLTRMLLIVKRLMDDKSVNRSIECFVEFRFQWEICCIQYSTMLCSKLKLRNINFLSQMQECKIQILTLCLNSANIKNKVNLVQYSLLCRWKYSSKKFPFSGIFLSFALPQTLHIIWGNPESRKILAITVDDSANKIGNSFEPSYLSVSW